MINKKKQKKKIKNSSMTTNEYSDYSIESQTHLYTPLLFFLYNIHSDIYITGRYKQTHPSTHQINTHIHTHTHQNI